MNPQRIANLVLIFSDVVLVLVVWGLAIVVRAAWGTSRMAGVLPTNTIAGVLPSRCGWCYGRSWGCTRVMASTRWTSCAARATLGALIIASTFFGLHQGQDVSRSVLIGGFLVLLIAAPLVRQLEKWSLKKARLWGSWMTTNSR
jgi:hypothetical protein